MTKDAFHEIMQAIDRCLGEEGVPAIARPLIAAARFPCDNKLIGSYDPDPHQGSYEGPNLMRSIEEWYLKHYSTQAVFPDRLHTRVVLIRGQVYRVRIPFAFNMVGKLNVLDHIESLSPSLLQLLELGEKKSLQQRFDAFCGETSVILRCQTVVKRRVPPLCLELLRAGWSDLDACGHGFNERDPAASLFPAQQATEKHLKAFLAATKPELDDAALRKNFGHGIPKLVSGCAEACTTFRQVIPFAGQLAYSQQVRYKRPDLTVAEVIDTIDLSHFVCALVAQELAPTSRGGS